MIQSTLRLPFVLPYGPYIVVASLQGLCEWRDRIARADDESTGYVLPNKTLLDIGKYLTFSSLGVLDFFSVVPYLV